MKRFLQGSCRWIGALLIAASLSACSQAPATTPAGVTAPTTDTVEATTPTADTLPETPQSETATPESETPTLPATVPAQETEPATAGFAELGQVVAQTLGVEVSSGEGVFQDPITGQSIPSYQVIAKGTGVTFQNVGAIVEKMEAMFAGSGWTQDVRYGASGPGYMMGYRQGKQLCILIVSIDATACPKGTSFADCDPEKVLFTITIDYMPEG
jgi:hypothetical protein